MRHDTNAGGEEAEVTAGNCAPVNGLNLYYEIHGSGAPLILLHGGADSVRSEYMLGGGQRDAGLDGSLRPTAQLAIIPGTTHYNILSTTAVAKLVAPFLDAA